MPDGTEGADPDPVTARRSYRAKLAVALAIVYVIWGSIYLGIRLVINEVDVFQAMAQRFVLAGIILVVVVVVRSGWSRLRVTRRQFGSLVVLGVLMLGLGNGLQALGQDRGLPSGVTALVVAGVPLWAVLLRYLGGDRPSRATLLGVVTGFGGLIVLVVVGRGVESAFPLIAVILVMIASLSWTVGSYFQGKVDLPSDIFVVAGYQQLVAAACSTVLAVGTGETFSADYTLRGWAALAYLVVFCSIIGFSAFAWLLRNAPLSLVATHAYVNPVVAVFLGWLVLGEVIGAAVLIGGGIVVASVVLVVSAESRPPTVEQAGSPPKA